jgi:hypothetical protein
MRVGLCCIMVLWWICGSLPFLFPLVIKQFVVELYLIGAYLTHTFNSIIMRRCGVRTDLS